MVKPGQKSRINLCTSFWRIPGSCLLTLRDGTLLCTSYGWTHLREDAIAQLEQPVYHEGGWVALGGYIMRSLDNGKTWEGSIYPTL